MSSSRTTTANTSTFHTKLATLSEFVKGMGLAVSEGDMSDALRKSGCNVEMAMERLLTGRVSNLGNREDGRESTSTPASVSPSTASSSSSSSVRKRCAPSSVAANENSSGFQNSIKRPRISFNSSSASNTDHAPEAVNSMANNNAISVSKNGQLPGKLLLCKRWTVASSRSRGRVQKAGEVLDFSENWRNNHKNNSTNSSNINNNKKFASSSSNPFWNSKRNNTQTKKVMDPMVRFRSPVGGAEGTLNKYLCSILAPLLKVPATYINGRPKTFAGSNHNNNSDPFIPMIYIEGEALMEDPNIRIGSDIPLSLNIYLNDPIGFFELFQCRRDAASKTSGAATAKGGGNESKFFFRKEGAAGKSLPWTGKKSKLVNDFSDDNLAEAAFHLLQWAEKGEEMVLDFRGSADGAHDEREGVAVVSSNISGAIKSSRNEKSAAAKGDGIDTNDNNSIDDNIVDDASDSSATVDLDVDLEEEFNQNIDASEDEDVKKLNRLVVDDGSISGEKVLPELSDPKGFSSGVTLHPYQRQALYWMCRREGLKDILGGEDNEVDFMDKDLELLFELAGSSNSAESSSEDIVEVVGGKAIACDCGPVVVNDDSVASTATPVEHYVMNNLGTGEDRKKYVHHPLWKRRFLATENFGSVFAFYVNELLGIATASPPNPPKQCVGGILADAMGLGKTVMLLALILKAKEANKLEPRNPFSRRKDNERDDEGDDSFYSETSLDGESSAKTSPGTTLVIAPLSLVSQWEEEIATKTNLSHFMYYSTSTKMITRVDSFSSFDVVITTYGTVQTMLKSRDILNPLLSFDWERVILDEAHNIKNPETRVSTACCRLKAKSRWCVTGTPIQNSLQDVYGLLKFLRHEPWCEAGFWRNAITNALAGVSTANGSDASETNANVESPDAMSIAFGRVRQVLAPIILRRTKDTLTEDGTPILTLPPIDMAIVNVAFSDAEREFYSALLERSQSVFEGFIKAGVANKSYIQIFSLLQRLRQACDHVSLVVQNNVDTDSKCKTERSEDNSDDGTDGAVGDNTLSNKFLSDLLMKFRTTSTNQPSCESTSYANQVAESLSQRLQSNEEYLQEECPICFEEPRVEDAVHTPCAHMFCRDCLLSVFKKQQQSVTSPGDSSYAHQKIVGGTCPVCQDYVDVERIIQIDKSEGGKLVSKYFKGESKKKVDAVRPLNKRDFTARETLELALNGASSSKLDAILRELDNVWRLDPGSKVLIFSQYLGFLDILGDNLKKRDVKSFRIDGKMTLKERVKMIDSFNTSTSNKPTGDGECRRGSVFLVSMKVGGVGLNLVSASSVFIADPWWNASIEDQCVNRIHRIGQKAAIVRVRKFIVGDSVEEKIVNLQRKKKGMANEILSDIDGEGQLEGSKPNLEDLKLIFGR